MKPQFFLWGLVVSSFTSASSIVRRQSKPVPPSQDPFYQPDAGFESKAPGAILKSRKLSQTWTTSNATYQLLFRSTDSNGQPNAVVTTILEPESADPKKLVSAVLTSDASFVDCSPSYVYQAGVGETGADPSDDYTYASALKEGWYVAVPDYWGFEGAFSNGIQEGQATLDSLRAALASTDITGVASDATVGIYGYSGGAVACEFATELQPCYAPELKIAGAAVGGIVPNITVTYVMDNKSPGSGLLPPGMLGLSAQDKDFRAHIESLLFPQNASVFNYAANHCSGQDLKFFANQDINSYFTVGEGILSDEMVVEFIDKYGIMGTRDTPKVPLYVYKGVLDQVSNITDTDTLVDKYCAAGASIQYVRNEGVDHPNEGLVGQDGAWSWLKDRVNGVPAAQGCKTTTVPESESTMPPSPQGAS